MMNNAKSNSWLKTQLEGLEDYFNVNVIFSSDECGRKFVIEDCEDRHIDEDEKRYFEKHFSNCTDEYNLFKMIFEETKKMKKGDI